MTVRVQLFNRDAARQIADFEDPYVGEDWPAGRIYRAMRDEYGRCTGKVYVDVRNGESWDTLHVGWTFESRGRYYDTGESYLREALVTLYESPGPRRYAEAS